MRGEGEGLKEEGHLFTPLREDRDGEREGKRGEREESAGAKRGCDRRRGRGERTR